MQKRVQYSNGAVLLNDFESTNAGDTNVNDTLQGNALETISVQFFADDQVTPLPLPAGSVLSWNANPADNVANDPPLYAISPFALNANAVSYSASFLTRNAYASALLTAAGLDPVYLTGQFLWLEPGQPGPRKSSRYDAFLAVSAAQNGGDNAPPSSLTIFSVGDGAATSLEALPTAMLALPALRAVYLAGNTGDELQDWVLLMSSAVTVAGQTQRPNDYSSAAPRVWFRKR